MLTRRENLLVRPWQQRRYHHHRKKVESALPVVDVGPPPERGHVSCKLKQVQGEEERCAQIGKDNCALVLRLAHIMRTSRVDNVWRQPPPTFLRRVGIYLDPASVLPPASTSPSSRPRPRTARAERPPPASPASASGIPSPSASPTTEAEDECEGEDSQDSEGRNLRCTACHPRTAGRRQRRREALAPAAQPPAKLSTPPLPAAAPPPRLRSAPAPPAPAPRVGSLSLPLDQVVITYKALRLAISFPPHASVRIRSGRARAAVSAGVSAGASGTEDLRVKRLATSA